MNGYCTPTLPWVASENETPSERCISYPVDQDGFWDLTKRPTSQHGSFISPCAADEDCATGHCVLLNANDYPNIDNDTYGCAAFMGDGQTIKHADQGSFIDGCAWPMVEVQEIADDTTTIKCGFPCTPGTAEEVCYHGADTCYSSNTVDTHYEGFVKCLIGTTFTTVTVNNPIFILGVPQRRLRLPRFRDNSRRGTGRRKAMDLGNLHLL